MHAHYTPQWTVVGAGPAGIATVGNLIDRGVKPDQILWIDPAFKGGDLGQKWRPVSSNTKVSLFRDYLNACPSFGYADCPVDFDLNSLPGGETCALHAIADPLQWVTDHLRKFVPSVQGMVREIHANQGRWDIVLEEGSLSSDRVVLAMGAEPLTQPFPQDKIHIPIDNMLHPNRLRQAVTPSDTVAVFGSSHTAIIALYQLMDLVATHPNLKVINFYRSPLKFAVYHPDWILHDNTGLKGYSAQWARQYLDATPVPNLERIHIEDGSFQEKYESCTKVIQALGFKRRQNILLKDGDREQNDFSYDDQTGRIAPGLYGVGIAFPQGHLDRAGNYEHRVGMWKFMDYINSAIPLWMAE